jgi:DNA topoisomerase-1
VKLLIVESPGKIKTLRKILGPGWLLEASVGHTTELAHDGEKNLGFEIQKDHVITRYVPRDRGYQILSKLRSAVKQADQVYLAMDPDREGEAIAWHLVEQLKLKKFARVAYTQITENAVKEAIRSPRGLDFPLVHAQRARQCLDKLVGFEVSPLLWNTTGGKSAGRVQSATLHLVCERERERLAFVPQDYWTLHSHYDGGLIAQFEAPQKSKDSPDAGKVNSKPEADEIEKIARSHPHVVEKIEDHEEKRLPPPPLITSSLQQMASMRLKFSPQKTMKIAQELYEGVGGSGLITYMRTDAVTLSPEFIQEAREWLSAEAPEVMPAQAPVFRVKADAQGAHEAIRPTSAFATPEKLKERLNSDQFAVYKLIWERAIASQCRPARLAKSRIEIKAAHTTWVARGSRVIEAGYLRFWRNIEDDRELPLLKKGQVLNLKDVKVEKKTTQPPSRYSEAKLVQLMEKLGIGRPSTYASTIATLKERDYLYLEKEVLAPTPLGLSTDEVLSRAIPELVDVAFTAQMEKSLDQIAANKIGWEKFLSDWNSDYFRQALSKAHALIQTLPKFPKPEFHGSSFRKSSSSHSATKESSSFQSSRSSSKSFSSQTARPASGGSFKKKSARKSKKSSKSAETGGRQPASSARQASSSRRKFVSSDWNLASSHLSSASNHRLSAADLQKTKAPECQNGHGPLEVRISKKGDPYWKCGTAGCECWVWPK